MTMPRDRQPYAVELSDSTHRCTVRLRTLWRDSDASAIDGALKWLKMHRNVMRDAPSCDTVQVWRGAQPRQGKLIHNWSVNDDQD